MKKIIFSLLALLACTFSAHADKIISGQAYKICTADGKYALSNEGSTANDKVLKMVTIDDDDEGQLWIFTESNGYWTIKSSLGNVCIDNPSEAHAKFNNQVVQWKSSGGNNQKWTFAEVDDNFYNMIPYENANKCYGYNDEGTFTFQDKGGENTRLQIIKAPTQPVAKVNGYYALQAVSIFPTYIYASEGKFLSFSPTSGSASLSNTYSYERSRFYITTDENGIASITMPQNNGYIYGTGTAIKFAKQTVDHKDASHFVIYTDDKTMGFDTKVALHVGTTTDASSKSSIKFVQSTNVGTSVTATNVITSNAFCFRLVKLPANKEVDQLHSSIAAANDLLKSLTGEDATLLKEAVAKAQDELDYPYLTEKDIVNDLNDLNKVIEQVQTNQGAMQMQHQTTGVDQAQKSQVSVSIENHGIVIKNAQHATIYNAQGVKQAEGTVLPSGAYVVVADGQTFKVAL